MHPLGQPPLQSLARRRDDPAQRHREHRRNGPAASWRISPGKPKGGDTDQIRAVGAGECGVAIANSYPVARLINSSKPDDRKTMEAVGVIWPNQQSWGTHINVSGGGMLKHAPTKEAARKFLEYLA